MRTCRCLATVALLVALTACGTPRRYGDVDGRDVSFQVSLDRAYVRSLSERQVETSVGVGVGAGSNGYRGGGVGVGMSFSSTQVYLIGGDGPAQGNVFRKQIAWGDSAFTVPLTPGRVLHLTVQVQGGYQGWEGLGSVTIPAEGSQQVQVHLHGDRVAVALTPIP